MKLYRFSPIKRQEELLMAIEYVHFSCYQMCYKVLGVHLPNSGNIGIFCHYKEEFDYLTELTKELTKDAYSKNQKYYELKEPIEIPARDGIPNTMYTHLYIRRVDPYRSQVGDIDFVLDAKDYAKRKGSIARGEDIEGLRIYPGDHLDMLELYSPDVDALGYICPDRIDN